jgi:hypothetical protein
VALVNEVIGSLRYLCVTRQMAYMQQGDWRSFSIRLFLKIGKKCLSSGRNYMTPLLNLKNGREHSIQQIIDNLNEGGLHVSTYSGLKTNLAAHMIPKNDR